MKLTSEQCKMLNRRGVTRPSGSEWLIEVDYHTRDLIFAIEKALTNVEVMWIYDYNPESATPHRYTVGNIYSEHKFTLGKRETRVEAALQAAKRLPTKSKPLTLQIPLPTEEGLCPPKCPLSEWRMNRGRNRVGASHYECKQGYSREFSERPYYHRPGPGCPWYEEASDE